MMMKAHWEVVDFVSAQEARLPPLAPCSSSSHAAEAGKLITCLKEVSETHICGACSTSR